MTENNPSSLILVLSKRHSRLTQIIPQICAARSGLSFTAADAVSVAQAQLASRPIDLIIATHALADGTIFDLLPQLNDVPLLFVADQHSEGITADVLQNGAIDWITETQHASFPTLLCLAIDRALLLHKSRVTKKANFVNFWKGIVSSLQDPIAIHDRDYKFLFVNDAYARMWSQSKEKIEGQHITVVVGQARFEEKAKEHVDRCFAGETIHTEQWVDYPLHGRRYVDIFSRPIRGAAGAIEGAVSVVRDLTAQKIADDELQFHSKALKHAAEGVHIITIDDANIVFANRRFEQMFGYDPGELIGQHVSILNAPTDQDPTAVAQAILNDLELYGYWEGEVLNIRKDGTTFWCSAKVTSFEHSTYGSVWLTIQQDIDEKKKTEHALRESEKRFRAVVENSRDIIGIIDENRIIQYESPAIEAILSYTADEIIGTAVADPARPTSPSEIIRRLVHPDDQVILLEQLTRSKPPSQSEAPIAVRIKSKDGRWRTLEITVTDFIDDPVINGFLTTARDISERKSYEQQLKRSEERYRRLVDKTPNGILIHQDQKVVFINPAGANILGGDSSEEIIGRPILQFIKETDRGEVVVRMQRKLAGESLEAAERRLIRLDGSLVDVEIVGMGTSFENQPAVQVVFSDITERKQAEKELKDLNLTLEKRVQARTTDLETVKNQIEAIYNNSGDAILLLDPQLMILDANDTTAEIFGQNGASYIGTPLSSHVFDEDVEVIHSAIKQIQKTKQRQQREIEFIRGDVYTYGEINLSPIIDLDGHISSYVGSIRDISDRKAADERLRYLAQIPSHMRDAVIGTDLDFTVRTWNKAAERLYGWAAQEVIGRPITKILRSYFYKGETSEGAFAKLIKTGFWQKEVVQFHRDGSRLDILASVVLTHDADGNPNGILAVNYDFTERKKAEQAIAESEARYRLLAENVTDMISRHTSEGIYLYVTPSAKLLTGYEQDKFIDHSMYEFLYEPDVEYLRVSHDTMLQGFDAVRLEYRLKHKNGSLQWVETTSHPIRDETGRVTEIVAVTRNINERKKAEEDLRVVTERLQLATQAAHIGIWEIQLESNQLVWDDTMLHLYGVTREDLSGQPSDWSKRVHPDDLERAEKELLKTVTEETSLRVQFRIVTPNGTIRHIMAQANGYKTADGFNERVIGINVDVTDLKQAEMALRSALKSEQELGELKSRIVSITSHEFRTPLAAILSTAETLYYYRERMTEEEIATDLNKIRQQVHHMKGITDDMLQFTHLQSGKQEFSPEISDLNIFCQEIAHEFNTLPDHKNRLIYTPTTLQIIDYSFDKKLMRQILNNLISNSLKYSAPDTKVHLTLEQFTDSIRISVKDYGIGIPKAEMKRLFDPFHRASNVGTISGTGLGLSIAKQAIERHGGKIVIDSKQNSGTTFTITFPLTIDEKSL